MWQTHSFDNANHSLVTSATKPITLVSAHLVLPKEWVKHIARGDFGVFVLCYVMKCLETSVVKFIIFCDGVFTFFTTAQRADLR